MTNEEAIKFLKIGKEDIDNEDFDEAIDIAIKAIKFYEEIIKNFIQDIEVKDFSSLTLKGMLEPTPYSPSAIDMFDCCKNCSNNPANGGSGFCNCALPYMQNPKITW